MKGVGTIPTWCSDNLDVDWRWWNNGQSVSKTLMIAASHLMQRKEQTPNVVQMIWRVFPGKKAMICTAVPQLIFVQAMHGHGI